MSRFKPIDSRLLLEMPSRLTDVDSWHPHIPLAFYCVEQLQPKVFVELGTHRGDSYCSFCQAVDVLGLPTTCYAIDTWQGDEQSGYYGPEILDELRSYHDPLYGTFSRLIKQTFDEAGTGFPDGTVDLLHIDGCHTYDAVRHDFETWLPKLSPRGVILLHDTSERERDFGVWQLWEEVEHDYPGFSFMHGHGLGVLAVGSNVSPAFMQFIEQAGRPETNIASLFRALGSRIELARELAAAQTTLNGARNALAAKEIELAQVQEAQTRVLRSGSWRVTAPARWLHAQLVPSDTTNWWTSVRYRG